MSPQLPLFYNNWFLHPKRWSLWRNRLARSTVNRKVGGSSPPKDGVFMLKKKKVKSYCAMSDEL